MATHHGLNGLNATSNGCAPLLGVARQVRDLEGECLAFSQAIFDVIAAHPELDTVVLSARWARHAEGVPFGEESSKPYFLRDAQTTAATPLENRQIYQRALARTLAALQSLNRRIVVLGPVPEIGRDVPSVLAKAAWPGQIRDLRVARADFDARQAFVLASFAQAQSRTPFQWLPLHDLFCDDAYCRVKEHEQLLYFEDKFFRNFSYLICILKVETSFYRKLQNSYTFYQSRHLRIDICRQFGY